MEDSPRPSAVKWKRIVGEKNAPWPKRLPAVKRVAAVNPPLNCICRARHGHRAVAIRDLMVVFGGGNDGILNELYVFNTANTLWYKPSVRGELPPSLAAFGMCCDGVRIFLFGGMIDRTTYSNELYELDARRWEYRQLRPRASRQTGLVPTPRFAHSFNIDSDGWCYVFGGLTFDPQVETEPRYLGDFWRIKIDAAPAASYWEELRIADSGPSPRESHTAVVYEHENIKQLILYGGMNGERLSDIWICDLIALTWQRVEPAGTAPLGRSLHSATLINERMYVFGGWVPLNGSGDETEESGGIEGARSEEERPLSRPHWRCSNDLCCFNVQTRAWESLDESIVDTNDQVPRARAGHSAVAVNSRVYIWSGRDGMRKLMNAQVCCKDMYALETVASARSEDSRDDDTDLVYSQRVPAAPALLQLVRASLDGCEITWTPVLGADSYVLQMCRVRSPELNNDTSNSASVANSQTPHSAVDAANTQPQRANLLAPPSVPTHATPQMMPTNILDEACNDVDMNDSGAAAIAGAAEAADAPTTAAAVVNDATSDTTINKPAAEPVTSSTSIASQEDEWHHVGVYSTSSCIVKEYEIEAETSDAERRKVGLEPGTQYKFRAASVNACGQSPWSPIATFRTCVPGYPGAPSSIKISKGHNCAYLNWAPPTTPNGVISEYAVYLAMRGAPGTTGSFLRVYTGIEPSCSVPQKMLASARIDSTPKPAVIFRIAARNEKGYGPATQVRWLQDSRVPMPISQAAAATPPNSTVHVSKLK